MDLASAIVKRRSVRCYKAERVPRDVLQQVMAAGQNALALRPDIRVRWTVVQDTDLSSHRLEGYVDIPEMFTPPPHHIIALSQERPGYMENLGFRMEQMILAATDLGLGTCWIGGTFNKEEMNDLVPDLGRSERIVAIARLGYADSSPSAYIAQQLLRWSDGRFADRKPLSETVSQYIWTLPWTGEDRVLNDILEHTRLAPSWNNAQPWHFVVDERWVIATAQHTSPYHRLDGGIAMCHLHLAARASGWSGRWLTPEDAEIKMLRDRYAIPGDHDILGIYSIASRT
jgi:nitroreductase